MRPGSYMKVLLLKCLIKTNTAVFLSCRHLGEAHAKLASGRGHSWFIK